MVWVHQLWKQAALHMCSKVQTSRDGRRSSIIQNGMSFFSIKPIRNGVPELQRPPEKATEDFGCEQINSSSLLHADRQPLFAAEVPYCDVHRIAL